MQNQSHYTSPATPFEVAHFFVGMASVRLLALVAGAAGVARWAVADLALADLGVAAGLLAAWPFIEWIIHKYGLHMRPFEWRLKPFGRWSLPTLRWDLRVAQTHRAHHRDPWDLSHVMIPIYSYAYSLPMTFLFWFSLFRPAQALTGVGMTAILGLHYELVHLVAHSRYRPRSRYYYRLWRCHRLHHCKNENHWLGVTMHFADRVFRTYSDPSVVETSASCRDLLATSRSSPVIPRA